MGTFKQFIVLVLLFLVCSDMNAMKGSRRDMRSFKILCDVKKAKPGDRVPLALEIKRKNGRTYIAQPSDDSSAILKAKQNWGDFNISVKGGKIIRGTLYISKDMRTYVDGKTVLVEITHKVLKKQSHKLVFTIDFNGNTEINFGGDTLSRTDGKKGSAGIRLFLSEGVDGHPGEDGSDGEDSEDIVIYIKRDTTFTTDTFVRVYVKRIKEDTSVVFVHNLQKYKLKISANGMDGGNGGNGGRGSGGKNARDATNVLSGRPAGNGGNGGKGGDAGDGGNAGGITVYIENALQHHVGDKILFESKPGKAGKPGKGGKGGLGGFGTFTYSSGQSGSDGPEGNPGTDGEAAPPPLIFNVEKIELPY